ncbi:hypothetical protein HHL22_10630 [Hymenobacter sp. RP-2-7]|uniref:Uncharacterized protein n=1 Tax=Hymenobacter polaris TaxID=2682546 RepID=A0A7Y0AEN0_9BACT|nr:hypothetical protein [Hymenobacter polaris]NML65660.1 hypothetical protein [Hymenobacter polaris]
MNSPEIDGTYLALFGGKAIEAAQHYYDAAKTKNPEHFGDIAHFYNSEGQAICFASTPEGVAALKEFLRSRNAK